jgi:hypothetical protein
MNALLSVDFGVEGQTLQDVIMNPDKYPIELQAAYMDVVNSMSKQIREAKKILEAHIRKQMADDNATKLLFKSIDGRELWATLKKGSMECEAKNADEIMKEHGFQPTVIGNYEFKPSWTKAKEVRKQGGDIQVVIDDLFKESKESIIISDN